MQSQKAGARRLVLALMLTVLLLAGCGIQPGPGPAPIPAPEPGAKEPADPPKPAYDLSGGFARPAYDTLPEEIRDWVDNSRPIMLGQSRLFGNYLYILVTYGEKSTGGYDVNITDIRDTPEALVVKVQFVDPPPGQPVTQALTYPYDRVVIAPTDREIRFETATEWPRVPTLLGIDHLPPIAAGRGGIQVFAPAPESTVPNPFVFRGIANTFEGTVNFRVETKDGELLLEHFTTGTMGDWGYFEEIVELPEQKGDSLLEERGTVPLLLRVFTYNAGYPHEGGGPILDEFEIPLTLQR